MSASPSQRCSDLPDRAAFATLAGDLASVFESELLVFAPHRKTSRWCCTSFVISEAPISGALAAGDAVLHRHFRHVQSLLLREPPARAALVRATKKVKTWMARINRAMTFLGVGGTRRREEGKEEGVHAETQRRGEEKKKKISREGANEPAYS
ncbi:MAG: hypothetical protein KF899_15120, partial [Parvibaculum sp.]|nr:hypothetical protein [Parvibaculum sp.]